MNKADPPDRGEYEVRYQKNFGVTGYGYEEVATHFPCPFCAAPDWLVSPVLEFPPDNDRDITCEACGRSARMVSTRSSEGVSMELVQSGGDDPADWLVPAPRRIDEGGGT